MKRQKQQQEEARIAPGMDNDEELEEKATADEIKKGEFTEVTTLSLDDFE